MMMLQEKDNGNEKCRKPWKIKSRKNKDKKMSRGQGRERRIRKRNRD
jgi:hypothetical protein